MKLKEFEAKTILSEYGVRVPVAAGTITKVNQLAKIFSRMPQGPWVLKAQVETGGRGKAGGIKIAQTQEEASSWAQQMLGMKLVTHQTGPEGLIVKKLLIERASTIAREMYLSFILDRKTAKAIAICSPQGGMDIEELAESSPESLLKLPFSVTRGLELFEARQILAHLNAFDGDSKIIRQRLGFIQSLAQAFLALDAQLLEINPLAMDAAGEFFAVDAKLSVDDNALFRHKDLEKLARKNITNTAEKRAHETGIAYIPLDGTIGCMVNGAGLAMATMDLIKAEGGAPANFLDVGGGASVEQVQTAFEIILSDKKVRSILVNIFGGIMRCDVIAEGIVKAAANMSVRVPMVVRLEGNRREEGRKILEQSGLAMTPISDLAEAAKKAVELAKK